MIFNRAIATLVLLMAANVALAGGVMKGDAAAGEALVGSCAACHGADGNSLAPTFPKLAGLGERYLLKQMKDIRDGRRPVALMVGQVDNMTDQLSIFSRITKPRGKRHLLPESNLHIFWKAFEQWR